MTADNVALLKTKSNLIEELDENKSTIDELNKQTTDISSENEYLKRQVKNLLDEVAENLAHNTSLETSVLELSNFETQLNKEKENRRQLEKTSNEKDSLLEYTQASHVTNLKITDQKYSKQLADLKTKYEHQLELIQQDKDNLESQLHKYSKLADSINNSFENNQADLKEQYSEFLKKQEDLNNY